ncbi:unnamed protein product [Bursaphelenchus okinawaensis]|uniref:DZANK-type domain-containing protein n=1 Tax=Bursaphelenchus okinawaensis TaxID=465554 RepID=A0A811JW20_9BILA|nr:unnamed protein product [Bursaphelenchus okinawaensis]CAG9085812.1 unnamed protein product [Bursaphelenchus okinawaensis]
MTESPVLLPEASQDTLYTCSLCKVKCIHTDDRVCPNCGFTFNFKCQGCSRFLKPHNAYCSFCGQKQISFFQQLRYDIFHHRFEIVTVSLALLVVLYSKRRHPRLPRCHNQKLELPLPNMENIGRTAQDWTSWTLSWIPGVKY